MITIHRQLLEGAELHHGRPQLLELLCNHLLFGHTRRHRRVRQVLALLGPLFVFLRAVDAHDVVEIEALERRLQPLDDHLGAQRRELVCVERKLGDRAVHLEQSAQEDGREVREVAAREVDRLHLQIGPL